MLLIQVYLILLYLLLSHPLTSFLLYKKRCLYPESFHLFSDAVCVGQKEASRHGPLCLPLMSDELYLLPPTDDRTLLRFSLLHGASQLQFVPPLLLAAMNISRGGQRSDSDAAAAAIIHLVAAVLFAIAVFSVLSSPVASPQQWADGLLTCDVEVAPGSALSLSLLGCGLELSSAWGYLSAPQHEGAKRAGQKYWRAEGGV